LTTGIGEALLIVIAEVLRATWRKGSPRVPMPEFTQSDVAPLLCSWAHHKFCDECRDYDGVMMAACLL